MILAFKKGLKYTSYLKKSTDKVDEKGTSIFPLMQLPLDAKGEETDLNDFQWWSYSDKWEEWLKKNPRDWKAESIQINDSDIDFDSLLESLIERGNTISGIASAQIKNIFKNGYLGSFDEYSRILEADDSEESSGSKDALKKFIKLGYAVQALSKSGDMRDSLDFDDLEKGKPYAVAANLMDGDGNIITHSLQAYRITKINENSNIVLANLDYSIPIGEINDQEAYLESVSNYIKDIAIAGLSLAAALGVAKVAGEVYLSWKLVKVGRGLYKGWGPAKSIYNALPRGRLITGGWNAIKNFAIGGGKKIILPSGAYVEKGLAYSAKGALLKGAAKNAVLKAGGETVVKGGAKAAANIAMRRGVVMRGAANVAARLGFAASNPVGWVYAAIAVVGTGVQQLINWTSDKQAPKYKEIKNFAHGTFSPKEIPIGKPITVCWTSDGGASGWGVLLDVVAMMKDDTRTTMELVKIGEFEDRSIFILIKVNSEMLEKSLKENDIVMLAFDNVDKFERGYIDNDDLEFETIPIQDMTKYIIGTSFMGYTEWDKMEAAYKEAPGSPFIVPEEAMNDYSFHFKNGNGKEVNVKGSLMTQNELESINITDLFPVDSDAVISESEINLGEQINENAILSFENFTKGNLNTYILEEESENNTEENKDEDISKWDSEYLTKVKEAKEIKTESDQVIMIAYKVDSKDFVDPNDNGDIGEFNYFIIGTDSISPADESAIGVEVTSNDPVIDPRFGIKKYVEPAEEPKKEDEDKEEPNIDPVEPEEGNEDESGDIIETTHGDVAIKKRKNSLTIKDRDISGGVNIFDEFASEELKDELNIHGWKTITSAKIRYSRSGDPKRVIVKNKNAKSGNKTRTVEKGEPGFKEAIDFIKNVEDGIKY